MKNISLLLNILLVAAVAVLYYLHFSGSKPDTLASSENMPADSLAISDQTAGGIVYVNSDSLLDNYKQFQEQKKAYEAKRDRLDKELEGSAAALEREVRKYQDEAPNMSGTLRAITEENLMKKQQALIKKRDDLLDNLREEEENLEAKIHDDLTSYLREYNRQHGHSFILGYSKGGGILLANDSLDITREILDGLNKKFETEKKKK